MLSPPQNHMCNMHRTLQNWDPDGLIAKQYRRPRQKDSPWTTAGGRIARAQKTHKSAEGIQLMFMEALSGETFDGWCLMEIQWKNIWWLLDGDYNDGFWFPDLVIACAIPSRGKNIFWSWSNVNLKIYGPTFIPPTQRCHWRTSQSSIHRCIQLPGLR